MASISKTIKLKNPKFVREDEIELFAPFQSFKVEKLKIKKLKNALVTSSGLCITKKGLVKECHHGYPHKYDEILQEAYKYYNDAKDDSSKLIEGNGDETYLLIHHPWFMYYHWVCESLFRLWVVKDITNDLVLLLPERYKAHDFVMQSLSPFNFKGIRFIPEGSSILVRQLIMPQIKPFMEGYDRAILLQFNKFYCNFALLNIKKSEQQCSDRIYISRKKALKRKVVNEDQLIPLLRRYNFQIVQNENLTFWEQVAIFSKTAYLISIHGSGLTNMIFMPEGGFVLELHKRNTNNYDWHSRIFWYLATASGLDYSCQICDPISPYQNLFDADIVVDIDYMSTILSKLFPDN